MSLQVIFCNIQNKCVLYGISQFVFGFSPVRWTIWSYKISPVFSVEKVLREKMYFFSSML